MNILELSFKDFKFLIDLCAVLDAAPQTLRQAEVTLRKDDHPSLRLSKRLNELEEKIGHARVEFLVDRKSRKRATVTPAGRALLETAKKIVAFADLELHRHERSRDRVVIAMSNAVTANLFPRILKETTYVQRFGSVDMKIIEREADSLSVTVRNNEADFALGPLGTIHAGIVTEHVCSWKRVLLYNKANEEHRKLTKLSVNALRRKLAEHTVVIPPKSIMPLLESKFLLPPTSGRHFKLPQAALRRAWVSQNIGVAISHEEWQTKTTDDVQSIDLSSVLGQTQMCFYFREESGERLKLSEPAEALIDSIKDVFSGHAQLDH